MPFSIPFVIIHLVVYLCKSPKLLLELNQGINKTGTFFFKEKKKEERWD